MYSNLKLAMKNQKVTATMIAKLLECRIATVTNKINGKTISGFNTDEALKIKKAFFQNHDYDTLFERRW